MEDESEIDVVGFMKRFEPTQQDLLYSKDLTPDQVIIIRELSKMNKTLLWLVENQLRQNRTVARHDKILSPIVAVVAFLGIVAGIAAGFAELFRK